MSRNDLPGPNAANFAQRLREAVMTYLGRQGDPLDRGITLRDLLDGGVVRLRDGYSAGQAVAGSGALPIALDVPAVEPDLTPPPTPTGFAVSAAISHVFIQHDLPSYAAGGGHLRTRVYGKTVQQNDPLPTFGDAAEITQFTGRFHAHPSNPATTWRLWIKWESAAGVLSTSPAGGTNGLEAVTGQDVATLLTALTSKITASQLNQTLGARINLIDGAASLPGSVNERIDTSQNFVTGLVTVPAYSASKTYAKGELATYNGNLYKATAPTQGNLPTDTSKWKVVGQYSSLANSFSAVFTDYLTTTETDSAISSATSGLVSTTALNTTLGSYVTTSTLTNDYYTKTATDDAISSATQNLVSTTGLGNTLTNYVTSAALTTNYYTQTQTNSAITNATTNLVSQTALGATLSDYATTASLTANYYTKTDTDSAISSASQTLVARYGELDAVQSWNFSGNVEGFTASGATLTSQGQTVRLTSTGGDPILSSPAVSIDGGKFTLVRARVRRVAGTGWQGDLFYSTSGHGASVNYRKNLGNTTVLNEWRLLEWDMADLTAGGADWTSNTITQLRFDLGATADDVFDIDWIAVGRLGVGAYSAAIQTLATTTAGPNGTTAQYTVKIDNNGYVTGYGLSSEANNATPFSTFGIRADAFYIASPSGPGVAPAMPFIVRTTGANQGVYLRAAFIEDGTIGNAKIADLSADKINAGFLNVDRLQGESVTASKIDSRGLTIKNSQGQVIFSANGVVGGGNLANNSDFLVQTFAGGPPLHFANYNNAQVSVTNQLLAGGPIANSYYWRITINAGGSSTMGFYFDSAASCFGGFKPNTNYIVSFYARCNAYAGAAFQDAWNLAPPFPGGRVALQNPGLSSEWRRYVWLINFGNNTIDPNGFFTISQSNLAPGTVLDFACVQVEQGDAPSGWRPVGVSSLNPITGLNVSTYVAAGAIGNAYIGNFIQSSNFNGTIDASGNITGDGTAGWAISKSGKAVLDNLVIRQAKAAAGISLRNPLGSVDVSSFTSNESFATLVTKGYSVSCGTTGFLTLYLNTNLHRIVDLSVALEAVSGGTVLSGPTWRDVRSAENGWLWDAVSSHYVVTIPFSLTWLFGGSFYAFTGSRPPGMSGTPASPALVANTLAAGTWTFRVAVTATTFTPGTANQTPAIAYARLSQSGWALEHQGVLPSTSSTGNPFV